MELGVATRTRPNHLVSVSTFHPCMNYLEQEQILDCLYNPCLITYRCMYTEQTLPTLIEAYSTDTFQACIASSKISRGLNQSLMLSMQTLLVMLGILGVSFAL